MESILLSDNQHWINEHAYDAFIQRELLDKALTFLHAKEILAIIGARRVGKSTLTKLMIKELLKKGIEAKNIFFINLEKPSFIPYKNDASYLETIFDEYLKMAEPDVEKKIYFFIDEIQIFKNWEVFVKSRYENSNIKFVITGSNSSLLTSNYASLLTGRVLKLRLSTFNFREFLQYKNIDISSNIQITKNRLLIQKAQDEYMKWGGYFSVISNDNEEFKREILKNIAEDIILKDIAPRYHIKNSSTIRDLFYYVVSNATMMLNYTSLAKKLGIDAKMIKEYILYFEDNFLVSLLSKQHNKLSESIKSSKKVYINDNGFLNLGVNPTKNRGASLENLVFLELERECKTIHYLRETKEIDFTCNNSLIQVSYTLEDEKTFKREVEAFDSFKKDTKTTLLLITNNQNDIYNDVKIIDFSKFTLQPLF